MFQIEHPETLNIDKLNHALREALSPVSGLLRQKSYHHLCTATFKQTIVGIGISWGNEFHPHGERIAIITDPHITQQKELTESLFHKLKRHLQTERYAHAMWSFNGDNDILNKVAVHNHFKLVRITYMPVLQIESVLEDLNKVDEAENLIPLEEVITQPELKRALFQLIKENYTATHLDSPVAEEPLAVWEKTLLDDSPDLKRSYIQFTDRVTGYVMLHPVSEQEVEVGWAGVGESQDLGLLQQIMKKQLIELKTRGFSKVTPEVDTTSHFAMSLFSLTDLKKEPALNTYQLSFHKGDPK
ncbi:hypothetical protein [Jeotgalibacillus terrae]|uniref:N-acetyltransferase domain-containing protein n=1 Tax=Jeotgalibacillus terrae TaxID=587735 RepID=A0ABW5ZII9_9BACL|nr:hypothetical protein [Jeotgalibacillus terrae]MBM7578714.1 hypothetical protein [Jeotgalibacillus terrae]